MFNSRATSLHCSIIHWPLIGEWVTQLMLNLTDDSCHTFRYKYLNACLDVRDTVVKRIHPLLSEMHSPKEKTISNTLLHCSVLRMVITVTETQ